MRPQPGRAGVAAALGQGGGMEPVDGLARRGIEGQVEKPGPGGTTGCGCRLRASLSLPPGGP